MQRANRAAALTVDHYAGAGALARARAMWEAILARMPAHDFHHTPAWHRCAFETAVPARHRHLLLVRRGGVPVGICPLRLTRDRIRSIALRVLDQPDFYMPSDVVAAPTDAAAVVHAVVSFLRGGRAIPHDVLRWTAARADGAVGAVLVGRRVAGVHTVAVDDAAWVACDHAYAAIVAAAPKRFRQNLRRARARLDATGTPVFHVARTLPELREGLATFLALEARGWKGRAGSAVAQDRETHRLFRHVVEQFGAAGQCEIEQLLVGSRCLSVQLSLVVNGTRSILKSAYDESAGAASPGLLLLAHGIERACADQAVHRVSFVRSPAWIRAWQPVRTGLWNVYCPADTPRGRRLARQFTHRHAPRASARTSGGSPASAARPAVPT